MGRQRPERSVDLTSCASPRPAAPAPPPPSSSPRPGPARRLCRQVSAWHGFGRCAAGQEGQGRGDGHRERRKRRHCTRACAAQWRRLLVCTRSEPRQPPCRQPRQVICWQQHRQQQHQPMVGGRAVVPVSGPRGHCSGRHHRHLCDACERCWLQRGECWKQHLPSAPRTCMAECRACAVGPGGAGGGGLADGGS